MKYLIFLIVFAIGCTKSDDDGNVKQQKELPDTVQNYDDVSVYSSTQKPKYKVRLNKVDSYGGTDTTKIRRLSEFAVGEDEKLFLFDGAVGSKSIHIYDSNGERIAIMGREGKGPGEFLDLRLFKIYEDELYAYDPQLQRFNIYSTESLTLNRTLLLDRTHIDNSKASNLNNYYVLNDTLILIGFSEPVLMGEESQPKIHYYLFDDTLDLIDKAKFTGEKSKFMHGNYRNYPITNTFPVFNRSLIATSEDEFIYTAYSDLYFVKKYNLNAEYISGFFYPIEKVPTTPDDYSELTNHDSRKELLSHEEMPDAWPLLNSIQFDDENRIWASTYTSDKDSLKWWILEPDGTLLGTFKWPQSRYEHPEGLLDDKVVRNNFFYSREKNEETGAYHVSKYRIIFSES